MSKSLTIIWQYLRAFVLIYACLYARNFYRRTAAHHYPRQHHRHADPFRSCWRCKIMPPQWVNPGCNILIRYMALLFVPIGVGVMQYWDLLRAQLGPVVISAPSARWWCLWW